LEEIVTIELFGQPHTFKADSNVTKAKEVADLLAKEVARVENQQAGQSSSISRQAILMLAALNIANEHMELKRNHTKLLHDVAQRTADLICTLDDSLQ
jgi:cell division protein ZapA (FtsZ GTPase activity inhibitor)